jgi:D-glycero-D-manno-heptose 1,7-bisphosphate phosphatase
MITILSSTKKKAENKNKTTNYVFFDVDGILWADSKAQKFFFNRINSEVKLAIKNLNSEIILISNQTFGAKFIKSFFIFRILTKIKFALILNSNTEIKAAYICEHHPSAINISYKKNCFCRKPNSELFLKAMKDYNIDPRKTFTVGDRITDLYASSGAGIHSNYLLANNRMFELNDTPNFAYEMKSVYFRFIKSLKELSDYQKNLDYRASQNQILYLAAGIGSRLHPLTLKTHKSLLKIRGETILSKLINGFEKNWQETSHIVNISHFAEQFSDLSSELLKSTNLTFSYERMQLGGTQTVLNLASQGNYLNNLLVVHGDLCLSESYVSKVIEIVSRSNHSIIFTHERDSVEARSEIISSDTGFVLKFSNTPQQNKGRTYVNSGIYFFSSKDLCNIYSSGIPSEIADGIIPQLIEQKKLKSYNINLPRLSIDSVGRFEQAQQEFFTMNNPLKADHSQSNQ